MSVNPGGGQRLEARHHHQTGLNSCQSNCDAGRPAVTLPSTVEVVTLLVDLFIIQSYAVMTLEGLSSCTVQLQNATFLYCGFTEVITAVKKSIQRQFKHTNRLFQSLLSDWWTVNYVFRFCWVSRSY